MSTLFFRFLCGAAVFVLFLGAVSPLSPAVPKHREILAVRTLAAPDLHNPSDPAWNASPPTSVLDVVANIKVELRTLHDGDHVYIQASFPDPTENRTHRQLVWDPVKKTYVDGPEREDVLIFKWSMVSHDTRLTLHEDTPYVADEWFWKAHRSDHAGYADDKIQIYSTNPSPDAKPLLSKSGKIFYLTRKGDEGQEAADTILYPEYAGDRVPKFRLVQPGGSRADIRAKGHWENGKWTVTFARKLVTGHSDDVAFSLDKSYPFGVSRFEIAGREPEPGTEEPLYGSGDVGEILDLRFAK